MTASLLEARSTRLFLAVGGTVNYGYKMFAAVTLSPLLYVSRRQIEKYLGAEEAARLKREAAASPIGV